MLGGTCTSPNRLWVSWTFQTRLPSPEICKIDRKPRPRAAAVDAPPVGSFWCCPSPPSVALRGEKTTTNAALGPLATDTQPHRALHPLRDSHPSTPTSAIALHDGGAGGRRPVRRDDDREQ